MEPPKNRHNDSPHQAQTEDMGLHVRSVLRLLEMACHLEAGQEVMDSRHIEPMLISLIFFKRCTFLGICLCAFVSLICRSPRNHQSIRTLGTEVTDSCDLPDAA